MPRTVRRPRRSESHTAPTTSAAGAMHEGGSAASVRTFKLACWVSAASAMQLGCHCAPAVGGELGVKVINGSLCFLPQSGAHRAYRWCRCSWGLMFFGCNETSICVMYMGLVLANVEAINADSLDLVTPSKARGLTVAQSQAALSSRRSDSV